MAANRALAYEALMDAVRQKFGGATAPIDDTGKPTAGRLELGDLNLSKTPDPESGLLICHASHPAGELWWHQAGDNSSDVLCAYGADPAMADQFNFLKIADVTPLDMIQIFALDEPAHWFYLTYGFTELYGTEEVGDFSGFGMELCMRLPRAAGETTPPTWPVMLLRNFAATVFKSKRPFKAGEYIDCAGPIFGNGGTIEGFAVYFDPVLDEGFETLSGYFDVFALLGLTRDEIELSRRMNSSFPFSLTLSTCCVENDIVVLDLQRKSLLIEKSLDVVVSIMTQARGALERDEPVEAERLLSGSLDFLTEQDYRAEAEELLKLARAEA